MVGLIKPQRAVQTNIYFSQSDGSKIKINRDFFSGIPKNFYPYPTTFSDLNRNPFPQAMPPLVAVLKICKTADPITTKMNRPNTMGPTGYALFFLDVVSGTCPLLSTFFWNLALFLSANRLEVVIVITRTPLQTTTSYTAPNIPTYSSCFTPLKILSLTPKESPPRSRNKSLASS